MTLGSHATTTTAPNPPTSRHGDGPRNDPQQPLVMQASAAWSPTSSAAASCWTATAATSHRRRERLRWPNVPVPEACDDQQNRLPRLEKLTLQHVIIDGDICSLPPGRRSSRRRPPAEDARNTTRMSCHGSSRRRRRRLAYWFHQGRHRALAVGSPA